MGSHYLDHLFSPHSIAVFGASERIDSVGGRLFDNLLQGGFTGPLYPINPKHKQVFGHTCYPALEAIGEPVELAVIATPAATVPGIIQACGEAGVRAAIIVSAGFREEGGRGASLEKALLDTARRFGVRLLGPNCLGLIRPAANMNATFTKNTAARGHLALVSQSGALCTAVLDWAVRYDVGFSTIASLGDAADVDFGDILDYLAQDPETHSILLYIEGVRDARRFMSGLRVAARMKPVVVIKSGRHIEGLRAAVTHTGAMVGSDDVFAAALQRAGVVRAMTIGQLFAAAQLLSTEHRPQGQRLAIVTNGGGPGVMAVDRAIDLDIELAELSESTVATLGKALPAHWSHGNPVDVLGDASPERYAAAVKACLDDPGVDGVVVMLTPQAMTDPTACAKAVVAARNPHNKKPVLTCWMGQALVEEADRLFAQHQFPNFRSPEASVEAFAYLATHARNQQLLVQVPAPLSARSEPDIEGARLIIQGVLAEQRKILTSAESKAILRAFNIPVTQVLEATSPNAALVAAETVGFPVAMKINSPDITHKSDVDGVRLNIEHAQSIRPLFHEMVDRARDRFPEATIAGVTVEPMYVSKHARELLVGVIRDRVFGPAITFGAGGTQVEIMRDRAIALPPLNTFLARSMIASTRIARLLESFRGMPAIDMDALVQVLRRVSEMVCELPQIQGLDINPLMVDENGVMAVDARVVVERGAPSRSRYAHMAIHPYPAHLVSGYQLADGTGVTIRPIRPEDAAIEDDFVRSLSPQSRYFRFMRGMNELTLDMLIRFTQLDYDRELALIAVVDQEHREVEIAVARYAINPDGNSCEFALVVADAWQNRGLGTHLMTALMEAARQRDLKEMEGEILASNHGMLELARNLGFTLHNHPDDPNVRVARHLL
ncbi:MAG: bifunctional acetate--CoA ligase family protein/GNAT family N-acetyltransferase [Thiogranum sp.]|nr:bifunctional acetate--CoA ligase family protein/GNAT family N-acetyltransferase [Thiogranum sp.]